MTWIATRPDVEIEHEHEDGMRRDHGGRAHALCHGLGTVLLWRSGQPQKSATRKRPTDAEQGISPEMRHILHVALTQEGGPVPRRP